MALIKKYHTFLSYQEVVAVEILGKSFNRKKAFKSVGCIEQQQILVGLDIFFDFGIKLMSPLPLFS